MYSIKCTISFVAHRPESKKKILIIQGSSALWVILFFFHCISDAVDIEIGSIVTSRNADNIIPNTIQIPHSLG